MRILYNSKNLYHKAPFGCLRQDEKCILKVDIPKSCKTTLVRLIVRSEDGFEMIVPFKREAMGDDYESYVVEFSLFSEGLYFYHFNVRTENEEFDLFRQGDGTNMESGDDWQLTCFDKNYDTPQAFKGKVMYQIFPDRFSRSGSADPHGKLEPYVIHENTDDAPIFTPDENGRILNNDFYGGDLKGICQKLGYLEELGVGIIYLTPIFFAYSNHRYDTADYKRIDPLLGDESDFSDLCDEAHKRGMKIILDGVFSHTGSNSVYFDSEHIFGNGACSNANSPYREWYTFEKYPYKYTSWWGIDTLPCVNEMSRSFMDYVIYDEDSVLVHWIKLGADGFRLDVADELPDEFIYAFKKRLKEIKPDSLLIGEVWEDASNKISYGKRRKYFSHSELDSVMNYPFKEAILGFVKGHISGTEFAERIMTIMENYPKPVTDCLMNLLSTHDTRRMLTELSGIGFDMSKSEKATFRLGEDEYGRAISLAKCAAVMQFTMPGNPCIYYGDEIGMEGYEDPLNRGYFRWDRVECELRYFYAKLAHIKNNNPAVNMGDICFLDAGDRHLRYSRAFDDKIVYTEVSFDEVADKDNTLLKVATPYINAVIYE